MGELIELKTRRSRGLPDRERPAPGHTAALLLFTGVRYERDTETETARETPGPNRPRGRRRA